VEILQQWQAVNTVLEAVKGCPEVKAAFIKGSLAYGTDDQYSDVDFYCLVEECSLESFLSKRVQLLESYLPLLYTSESNFVGPQIVAVFNNGLHFDLYTVTTSSFPLVGSFKALYDPYNLLPQYLPLSKDHSSTLEQVETWFSEFSFTLLELFAAWNRQDLTWAYRLSSHLVGDLGLVLRFKYDRKNAILGLKRLEAALPTELRAELREAVTLCHGESIPQGVARLCSIMESEARELEKELNLNLAWPLFRYMQANVVEIARYAD